MISSSSIDGSIEDVKRRVDVVEVYDELAELVLGVLDLVRDLGALGDEA